MTPVALPEQVTATIHRFLRAHVTEARAEGVVLGLSGGIDSALAARLAVDALGRDRVRALLLPDARESPALLEETKEYARSLGVAASVRPIEPIEAAVRAAVPEQTDRVGLGNSKARIRMVLLYAFGRAHRSLVLGTGNKSELLLGYFTKYGDGGVDLLPLGDLYKTQVWALAESLALPEPIRSRAPTAGLYEGQTDESELGLPYQDLDRILRGLEELRSAGAIAAATGLPQETVERIEQRVLTERHKRRLPPIPKIGLRTVGLDWRD